MANPLKHTADDIESAFEVLESWEERYRFLIDLGRKLPPMAAEDKTEDNRIKGCQSIVFLAARWSEEQPPQLRLEADSDSTIVKGLAALLVILYYGKSPEEILKVDASRFLTGLGLDQHLSPTRRNGLHGMVERIRRLAVEGARQAS